MTTQGAATLRSFSLEQSAEYVLLVPLTRVLDELTLLDDRQHAALGLGMAVVMILAAVRAGSRGRTRSLRPRVPPALRTLAVFGVAIATTYVGGAIVPRPMVALVTRDPELVLVDFHSHTARSHDGRWRFSAEDSRSWHSGAGFHAAYLTDHQTMQAWERLAAVDQLAAMRPGVQGAAMLARAGGAARSSTTLLPGIETVVPGAHLNLLGVSRAHLPLFSHRRNLDTVLMAAVTGDTRPLALLTLPFDLGRASHRPPRIDAIELSNGAPRGLRFAREHRARIVALAESLDVPLVSASNHHGWGSTAVAWTALRIPAWREMPPLELDRAIRSTLGAGAAAVTVIERTALASSGSRWSLALTLPRLALRLTRILTPAERLSMTGWLLGIWWVARRPRRRSWLPAPVASA